MAINFPNSPTNGQIFTSGGKSYEYNSTTGVWNRRPEATSPIPADISDLTDTTNLLFDGQYSSLAGAPTSSTAGALGTLTKTFTQNEETEITLSENISPVPNVSVFKEVPQGGLTSKGNWDVNANATNYDFFDEKPISYSNVTLTPSATGDGTFSASPLSGYSLSGPSFGSSFNVGSQASNPQEVVMKTDGTKMYVLDVTSKTIFEYDLSTNFDSSTATYNSVNSGSLGTTISGDPYGLRFKPDGTKLYICEYGNIIYQFSLGTAWDLSTISYDNTSITNFAGSGNIPYCLAFKPDGTKVYTVGYARLYEWELPTAWSLSGATPTNIANGASADYLSISSYINSNSVYALDFSADGTKFFVRAVGSGSVGTGLFEVPIDSAWDPVNSTQEPISTDGTLAAGVIRYDALDTAHGSTNLTGFAFVNNGQQAVVCYSGAQDYVYTLNTFEAFNFSSTDVGKKVVGNSGSAVITATSGTYQSVTPFADTSAISSWQLFGAEGKSDGTGIQLAGIAVNDVYNLSTASNDNKTFNASSQLTGAQGIAFKDDGTAMYLVGYTNDTVYQYDLSTAWDVSTASYASKSFSVAAQDAVPRDIRFKSDGTSFYVIASTAPDSIYQYDLSTAWDISTASYSNKSFSVQTQSSNPSGLAVSADGTKFYVNDYGSAVSYQYDLSTAWDISTASYSNKSLTSTTQGGQIESIDISSDGLKFFMSGCIDDAIFQYDLSTAWDLSTASTSHSASLSPTDLGMEVAVYNGWYNIVFSPTGHKLYTIGDHDEIVYQISTGAGVSYTHPYSQYSPALTNSTGQINSTSWTDIDSMVADETKNDGDVFYAVSTDNRTSWGVIKDGDGVRKIARNNSGTWQYNNNVGTSTSIYYNADGATYNSSQSGSAQFSRSAMYFNSTGTKSLKLAWVDGFAYVRSFTYSTAYDLTTESYTGETFTPVGFNSRLLGFYLKPDGTKFYVTDHRYDRVIQYDMSTPFDPSSATTEGDGTFVLTSNGVTGNDIERVHGIEFKPDGTRMYIADWSQTGQNFPYVKYVQYDLSTSWDVTTASHAGQWSWYIQNSTGDKVRDLAFWPDGTKVLVMSGSSLRAEQYTLSVAWDITSTMTSTGYYLDIGTNTGISDLHGGKYAGNNGELFIVDGTYVFNMGASETTISYGTSETWVDGTNNDEHATLQEALGAQSFNRMDKAQLQAVTDPNYYVLGDTLDLMIAPYATSGASPLSDGVTIGYQAEALVRQAINGTDYEAEFPALNKVKIKSLAAQNLKIRVI